ncbi:hypothetical protein Pint_18622 [Pistacia integerrima]|uniref:Uncharacterized protein n=1 Tax=Pistacia integerrima TaxID=434235 RepID=A0ACC0Z245_9ROSI|nr:hypothetical protein Pint_18622 [Pistacia integerrima]
MIAQTVESSYRFGLRRTFVGDLLKLLNLEYGEVALGCETTHLMIYNSFVLLMGFY